MADDATSRQIDGVEVFEIDGWLALRCNGYGMVLEPGYTEDDQRRAVAELRLTSPRQ